MLMKKFRVQNFRSINDSGWVEVSDIATIIGKNESGKTSLLKALWKFNPYKKEVYNLDREFPRGRRKDRSEDAPVSSVVFAYSADEVQLFLKELDEFSKGITGVEITKQYNGVRSFLFVGNGLSTKSWVDSILKDVRASVDKTASKSFSDNVKTALDGITNLGKPNSAPYKTAVEQFKTKIKSFASTVEAEAAADNAVAQKVMVATDAAIQQLSGLSPWSRATDLTDEWMPKFIYMDDHKTFTGSAYLNEIKARKDSDRLTEEDKTIMLIMEMAGLDFDEECEKSGEKDREQRMLDMSDASSTLTSDIASRWRQKQYEVQFQADGHHFMTFVKDMNSRALVPLDERSKGFQWFFSFDMTFMYETGGKFENAIILLDEPGLHLHADAQKDLLERFKTYSKSNQLIYTTHLPFMVDARRMDNVWVMEENVGNGSRVHQNWETADKDARFTLQAAMGLSWSQSLFVGQNNLVVEGVTDFWFINAMSAILKDAGKAGLDERLVVTPAGGATKVAYVGTLLSGQDLNVAVLLDADKEGQVAQKQLVHQWVLEQEHVVMLDRATGRTGTVTIEDLFDEKFYVDHVTEVYKSELKGKKFKMVTDARSVVERVELALKEAGIEHFNKGRVAKKILEGLSAKGAGADEATLKNFQQVFDVLNGLVESWQNEKKPARAIKTKRPVEVES